MVDPALVTAWITLQKSEPDSPEHEALFGAFTHVWEMCHDDPAQAWEFVHAVLAADQSNTIMENLSAGPLEDLLVQHPAEIIVKVEAEAQVNPAFRKLLGGVWKNDIPDDVWKRVQAVWDRSGWDGIPRAESSADPDDI